jgi:hypothetical protein
MKDIRVDKTMVDGKAVYKTITNIIICTHEPVPCVIGSTLNPTANIIKNIGINIK